jgi:hypothetical protein
MHNRFSRPPNQSRHSAFASGHCSMRTVVGMSVGACSRVFDLSAMVGDLSSSSTERHVVCWPSTRAIGPEDKAQLTHVNDRRLR